MKNKLMILLLLITMAALTLLTSSCTKDINMIDNQDIIKKVIELERNEYLLKTVKISYNEYLRNVKPLLFTNSGYLDKYKSEEIWVNVKNLTIRPINKSEILNANKDELQKVRDRLVPPNVTIPVEVTSKYEPPKISKVYNDENMKGKRVFVAQLEDVYEKDFDVMYYRSYIFRKENNDWKIFDTSNASIMGVDRADGGYNINAVNKKVNKAG